MPTYDYECEKCKWETTVMHKMKESPLIRCMLCMKLMKKCFHTGSSISFKGSGFYETDYKDK